MRFHPAAILGLMLGLALIPSGCGDDRGATAGERTVAVGRTGPQARETAVVGDSARSSRAGRATAARRCAGRLGEFLDSMESLANTLAIGLDYAAYLDNVNRVRATYAGVPAESLSLACLARVAAPAEHALDVHIAAVNAWGDCLADPSCDPASVEPELQSRWATAADLLAGARDGLRRAPPGSTRRPPSSR